MNIAKKKYEAPKMSVMDLKFQSSLLSCSGDCEDIDDFKESSDEFGLNMNVETDHKA